MPTSPAPSATLPLTARVLGAAKALLFCALIAVAILQAGCRATPDPEATVAPSTAHRSATPLFAALVVEALADLDIGIPSLQMTSPQAMELDIDPLPAPTEAPAVPEPVAALDPALASVSIPVTGAPLRSPSPAAIPFAREIERWRPLVRQTLAEASAEGRLTGAARKLDEDLLLAMIQQESAGDHTAESWAGALGLMQLMPTTFAGLMTGDWYADIPRETILDPTLNVRAGVRYMAEALQIHRGDLYWSVASYNAGAGATQAWISVGLGAVPPMGGYWETAAYAPSILTSYASHRPDVPVHLPAPITEDQLPAIITLLTNAGLW